ncbi:hypothetical protein B0H13DRAFT_1891771 [Mycena leptocephala]|nr:hypothetical protein B0H13DRAFT_1891771 [Mycena leptocephala]
MSRAQALAGMLMVPYQARYITSHQHAYGYPRIGEAEAEFWLTSVDTRVVTNVGAGVALELHMCRERKKGRVQGNFKAISTHLLARKESGPTKSTVKAEHGMVKWLHWSAKNLKQGEVWNEVADHGGGSWGHRRRWRERRNDSKDPVHSRRLQWIQHQQRRQTVELDIRRHP